MQRLGGRRGSARPASPPLDLLAGEKDCNDIKLCVRRATLAGNSDELTPERLHFGK